MTLIGIHRTKYEYNFQKVRKLYNASINNQSQSEWSNKSRHFSNTEQMFTQ